MQSLVADGAISRADFDQASAEQKSTEARVGEIKASISRKTIRAPFSGILGIRQVNLGQYLSGGDAVVPLQALHPIYVNFGVPQQETARVRVGGAVRLTADELSGTAFAGRVTAVDSVVNPATRNVQVQATVPNPDGKLRPGMFVQTAIVTGTTRSVVSLPASAIGYAPFGDSVYVLADLKGPDGRPYRGVRQQFVKLGPTRGDRVAVLSGISAGDEVVTSGVFKLRNGAAVNVNNSVQPGNNVSPKLGDS
jgi:membrane fusion protein (multidrug efflux system)